MAEPTPEAGALANLQESTKNFREASEKIRTRADVAAKTFGGLATTALAGIGIAKFSDVFPFHRDQNSWRAVGFLIVGFLLMAAVVAFFTHRLLQLNRPLVMSADLRKIDKLEDDEVSKVGEMYAQAALLNRVASLSAYEARAHRFERIADRSDDARATRLRSKADLIVAEIRYTLARAALVVIRQRATGAISGRGALVGYVAFLIGIFSFGLSADYLSSKRTDEVTLAKACAEAQTAGAIGLPATCTEFTDGEDAATLAFAKRCAEARTAGVSQLPAKCLAHVPSETPPIEETPTVRRVEAEAIRDLGDAWLRCQEASETSGSAANPLDCAAIRDALSAAIEP